MSTRPNTKEALIRSAEKLFAERGLGAVSVKDITQLAGAKNPSAVHYHFGNLESLIKQVFSQRYLQIERERLARFEKLELSDDGDLIQTVLETALASYLEACLEEEGRVFVRFCVQVATDPRFDIGAIVADIGIKSIMQLREILLEQISHVPEEKMVIRLRQAFVISLMQAADFADRVEAGTALPVDEAVREAASCLAGYLSADV